MNLAPWQKAGKEVADLLESGKLDQASLSANLALRRFPGQPSLHLLNGHVYEKLSSAGHHDHAAMAQTAYQATLNLDPHNWYALWRLSSLKMDQKEFVAAQKLLVQAAELRSEDPRILYELAFASYYAGDLPLAYVSIKKALEICLKKKVRLQKGVNAEESAEVSYEDIDEEANFPVIIGSSVRGQDRTRGKKPPQERFRKNNDMLALCQRGAAVISGASGFPEEARTLFNQLKTAAVFPVSDLQFLDRRLNQWRQVYQKQSAMHRADMLLKPAVYQDASESGQVSPEAAPPIVADQDDGAVVLDCVVLVFAEDIKTGQGMNLLNNFAGNIFLTMQPQNLSRQRDIMQQTGFPKQDTLSRTFTGGITWGAIQYNANILNVGTDKVEVVGRPTLTAFLGRPALFDSGITITGAIQANLGGDGGGVVQFPTGTRVLVTPRMLGQDLVDLDIDMTSSIFMKLHEDFPQQGLDKQTLQLAKTQIQTQIRLRFGETGMLGGNYQRETSVQRTGVPFLEKIPLIQYFFSRKEELHGKRSVLFLVTPRRSKTSHKAFDETISLLERRKKFPQLSRFLQSNQKYLGAMSNQVFLYKDIWEKIDHYHHGDVLKMPQTQMEKRLSSLRNFLYY